MAKATIGITEGSGKNAVTDNVAGDGHYSVVKMGVGDWDATVSPVSLTNPMPTKDAAYTSGGHGAKVVTTAATPVQLNSTSTACQVIWVKAKTSNSGVIAWGFSNTVRAAGTILGDQLEPGEKVALPVNNLSLIWIDASVNGDGVTFSYVT